MQYKQHQQAQSHRPPTKEAQDAPPTAADLDRMRDEDCLRRHLGSLKRELDLDSAERQRVEEGLCLYLHGALKVCHVCPQIRPC